MTWHGILLSLILGLVTIQANPIETKDNNTTTKPDKDEGGLSKGVIAVIIGIGLTTFFVVVIAYYMVRGYRQQSNADVHATEFSAMEEIPSDHTAAQSNLGLSSL